MEHLNSKTIGVLMGGPSSEREVSLATGNAVIQAIQSKGLRVVGIDVDQKVVSTLETRGIDLAFIALHGTYGEDGSIQGLLEFLKIPYTGAGILASAVAFNKVMSKAIFKAHGIPTANYKVLMRSKDSKTSPGLPLPLVVKPSDQGSSIGVSIVHAKDEWQAALDEAFSYSDEILVEQFINGKLLAIGMNGETPMPIVQIVPRAGFYDYEAKYSLGKTDYFCPAVLTMEETKACQNVSLQVWKALKARGIGRVDVVLDSAGVPQVLELNTIPGLTPTSLLPKAAKQAGIEFSDLILKMLVNASLDYSD